MLLTDFSIHIFVTIILKIKKINHHLMVDRQGLEPRTDRL